MTTISAGAFFLPAKLAIFCAIKNFFNERRILLAPERLGFAANRFSVWR